LELQPLYPEGVRIVYGAEPKEYHEPTKLDECAAFILEILEEGPVAPKEVVAQARDMGFSRDLVYRAHTKLQDRIQDTVGRRAPDNQWELKGK
jgi:hypothetical protein